MVAAGEGEGIELINNEAGVDGMDLVATMIGYEGGVSLLSEIEKTGNTTIELGWTGIGGAFVGIGKDGRLMEVGWEKIPILKHVIYASQYLEYQAREDEYYNKFR